MDISKRINILALFLLAVLTALIFMEDVPSYKKEGQSLPAEEASQNLFKGSEGEAFVDTQVPHYQEDISIKKPKKFTIVNKQTWMAPPAGFFSALTNNYLVYREGRDIPQNLKDFLAHIHGNFVLDVIPFSVVSDFKRIFLMLFRTKESYSEYTQRPSWSVASTDVGAQSIFILENSNFKTNFTHELTHIYFDGYFLPSEPPLWLSEGFAVYIQTQSQTQKDKKWLKSYLSKFTQGKYIEFNEFVATKDLQNYSKEDVLLWYAQAYSVVDYLLTSKTRDEFFQFCKNLKEGSPTGRSLYRAYGMPFNKVSSLEYAWQSYMHNQKGAF
ncbi:MAG: hypothetical protein II972_02795 [Elusimicrobiaceae bacterium]|nr:hypothetical protein [Elusimicrobiaceae bacterium]